LFLSISFSSREIKIQKKEKVMKKNGWIILMIGLITGGFIGLCVVSGQTQEKAYPNRQIDFVIPYDPGGSIDMMSRIFVEAIKDPLKVPVVPMNKPGAGGSIGTMFILNTKPDGYTVGACSLGSLVISPIVEPKLPYKRPDLTVVCKTINFPIGLFVNADAPWKTLKEFVDYAKANPGKIRAAVGGPTGAPALLLESFKIQAGGLSIINIPSKGGASMATAILGGHVEICSDPVAAEVSLLKAGRVRALATSNKVPGFPQIPTFEEAGVSGVTVSSWAGIIAPKALPKPVLEKLTSAFETASKNPTLIDQLNREAMNVDFLGPEAFARQLEKEDQTYLEITRKVGLVK
jgi:tripartite-type tricarboxylate transporter receptor subunit TctC